MPFPYAGLDDVKRQMGVYSAGVRPAGSTLHPNEQDVNDFITDVAEDMDILLSQRGVTLPVDQPPEFVRYLKVTNAIGAAARVVKAMFPQEAGRPGGTKYDDDLDKMYEDRRSALASGVAIPAALVISAASPLPRSYQQRHPQDDPVLVPEESTNESAPAFTRGQAW